MTPDLHPIVRAVYQAEICDQSWLQTLADALREVFVDRHGVLLFVADWGAEVEPGAAGGVLPISHVATSCMSQPLADALLDLLTAVECSAGGFGVGGSLRAALEQRNEHAFTQRKLGPFAVTDVWSLIAEPFQGRTVGVLIPVCDSGVEARLRKAAMRLSDHLASGVRLRAGSRLAEATSRSPLEQLLPTAGHAGLSRRAVIARHRSGERSTGRAGYGGIATWRALLRGDLSVIDRFETQGSCYLIARDAGAEPVPKQLSHNQYQSMVLRSAGHPLKVIANQLGVSISTVSAAVARGQHLLKLAHITRPSE